MARSPVRYLDAIACTGTPPIVASASVCSMFPIGGNGVPLMDYAGGRPHMDASTRKRVRTSGPDAYVAYQAEHNARSIDGLPAVPR